ncbi:hypothetical protein ACFL5V_09055 [Fibrobacterota bacterium]
MKTILHLFFLYAWAHTQYDLAYPHWFYYPDTGIETAVGYVYDATNSAFADGAMRYWGQKLVKVSGERKYYSWDMGHDFRDSIFLEPRLVKRDSLELIAVHKLDHDSLVLVGRKKAAVNGEIIKARNCPRPAWVTSLPKTPGFVYGLGTGKFRRGVHHRSWSLTDENAIVSCAKSVRMNYRNLLREKSLDKYSRTEHVASEKVQVTLKEAQVVGRWLDVKAKTCFSLVRARPVLSPEGK